MRSSAVQDIAFCVGVAALAIAFMLLDSDRARLREERDWLDKRRDDLTDKLWLAEEKLNQLKSNAAGE